MKTLSQYALPYALTDGTYVVFCTRNQALISISESEYQILCQHPDDAQVLKEQIRQEVYDAMVQQKMLVDKHEDQDYLAYEVLQNKIASFANSELSLTIAPTCDCNFACPYCYEKHKRQSYMSDEVIDQLAEFVEKHEQCKTFSVTWYGGEPLMAFEQMKKIAKRLSSIKSKKWVGHSIVSNTSLITDEVIDFFREYELQSIQVSIDGTKAHHDLTRRFKCDKSGSFNIIMANIKKLLLHLPNTKVVVRVNIDKNTANDFGEIAKYLSENFKNHLNNLSIYPGYIRVEDKEQGCWNCNSVMHNEQYRFFENMAKDFAIPVNWIPQKAHKGCGATSLHSFIIGPEGDLYKCWNDFGDKARCVGYINNTDKKGNQLLLMRYLGMGTGFNDAACTNCAFLPVCDTGCPWERMANLYEGKHFNLCTMAKNHDILTNCLSNYVGNMRE